MSSLSCFITLQIKLISAQNHQNIVHKLAIIHVHVPGAPFTKSHLHTIHLLSFSAQVACSYNNKSLNLNTNRYPVILILFLTMVILLGCHRFQNLQSMLWTCLSKNHVLYTISCKSQIQFMKNGSNKIILLQCVCVSFSKEKLVSIYC